MDRRAAATLAAAACSVCSVSAFAAVNFSGGASTGIEYNDNALDRSNREQSKPDSTSARMSVSASAATEGGGPANAQLQASYSRSDSFSSDELSHSEHSFSGSFDWKPLRFFDMTAGASQTRAPMSLADVGGERSVLQTSSQAQAMFHLRPTNRWQLGFSPAWGETKTPLPNAQQFKYRQNSRTATIDYLGAGPVVVGLMAGDYKGVNRNIENPTRSKSETVQGTVNYRATAVSSFSLSLGYARYTNKLITPSTDPTALAIEGTSSGISGSLSIQRQLTVKTGVNISASRSFQQYAAGVNPSTASNLGVGLTWKASSRISANLDTQYSWSTIEGAQGAGFLGRRNDLVRTFSLGASYSASRRLSLGTYLARRIRNSDLSFADQYNGYSAGMSLSVTVD